MRSKKLGRAAAAAGLMVLLAPGVAFASWWDGGYDGSYDGGYNARRGNGTTTTTSRQAEPGYQQPPESDESPDYGPPPGEEAPPPAQEQPPEYSPPPDSDSGPNCCTPAPSPDYNQAPECCAPPPPPPPPPPGPVGPVYGCENSDLADTGLGLHKTTTPPPGTPVAPGDEILVDITWHVLDWMGPDLHKAIDCVYINGVFAPWLSGGERPTPNDGHFAFHYFVPLDVPPGSEICDQGFVSGPNGWEEYGRAVSNVVCFPVAVPPPPPPSCCAPPPPSCCAPPPVEETTTTTTTAPDEEQPYTESEQISQRVPQETPPAATVLPATRDRDALPRTGSGPGVARFAAAGLALAALIRRRTRRS